MTLVLLARTLVTAFVARVDWRSALQATVMPHMEWSRAFFGPGGNPWHDNLALLVLLAGGRGGQRGARTGPHLALRGATREELEACRTDVTIGMFSSNVIMYFIIMTTAATLHAHGKTHIATAQEAAEALRPLAGAGAYWLFTLGLIGTGMLAVPVLAGSCAFAHRRSVGLARIVGSPTGQSKKVYLVLAVAMAFGIALNYAGLNAIKLLFTTAVINGVLAPPLILIVALAHRRSHGDG